jgi:sirohydrochlorin ferrochelatase
MIAAPPPDGLLARPGLLVIAHGTRSAAGVAQAWDLVRQVRALDPDPPLAAGFLEFARPSVDEAIDGLVGSGCTTMVAVPLVLLGAGHLKNDGPAALARARQRHPQASFLYARDFGIHPLVLAVAEDRVRSCLPKVPAGPPAVVLVGRGSTDPDANADLYKVARLLADRPLGPANSKTAATLGPTDPATTAARAPSPPPLPILEPAFVSLARPSVPEALERCRLLGAQRVAVVPYFLFTGVLADRIATEARAWAATNPGVQVAVGRELAPDARLARLVLERHTETLAGRATMNCDCCIYRAPLPGYEEKVGAPLPHPHPHS